MRHLLFLLLVVGCGAHAPARDDSTVTDRAYLTSPFWNDGKAEVAFYQVERSRNQYGRPDDQRFVVGTYVVKHDFDRAAMTKAVDGAAGVPAFKYALFYEIESGSYEYKRHWVVNARQADLAPLKHSFTSFDWCANRYDEMAFGVGGTVHRLMRSDDYGNAEGSFAYRADAFTTAQLPLLVRALDFAQQPERAFSVVLADGAYVGARARLAGRDTVETAAGPVAAERIVVAYDRAVPSMVGEESDLEETYWRGVDPARLLLRLEGASGRYRMTLVEPLRTAYWSENFWPLLQRVTERP